MSLLTLVFTANSHLGHVNPVCKILLYYIIFIFFFKIFLDKVIYVKVFFLIRLFYLQIYHYKFNIISVSFYFILLYIIINIKLKKKYRLKEEVVLFYLKNKKKILSKKNIKGIIKP